MLQTTQGSVISTRETVVQRTTANDTSVVIGATGTRILRDDTGPWFDPICQSFLVDQKDGIFVTSVDLFFKTKSSVLPATVQIRTMEKLNLKEFDEIRYIIPGRTYRSDHDATHSPMFHQCEGLVLGKNINMGHLKGCLIEFCRSYFNVENLPVRFRPSYFPFTEPSAEVDIGCKKEKDGSLSIGEGEDWLEILGSGMIHPKVLEGVGINSNIYQGFAFGMGLERLTMLKYGIPDLRPFYDSDLRWLKHYGFLPIDNPSLHSGLNGVFS